MKPRITCAWTRRVAAICLVVGVLTVVGVIYASHGDSSLPGVVAPASAASAVPPIAGSPFGPATKAASQASKSLLECFTQQGATAVPIDGGGVGVSGLTDAVRQACSAERSAMQAAQTNPQAVREREVFFRVLEEAQRCTITRLPPGFEGDHDIDPKLVQAAMRACEDEAFRAHDFTRADVPTP